MQVQSTAPLSGFKPGSKGRCAIYRRVSTARQVEEGHSLETQDDEMRMLAFAQGLEVAYELGDDGVSGYKSEREDVMKLRQLVVNEEIDAVVIYDSSRMARGLYLPGTLWQEMLDHNVTLHSVLDTPEDTPLGHLIFFLRAWMHTESVRMSRLKSMAVKRNMAEKGMLSHGGPPPYGLAWASKVVDGETITALVRDPATSTTVVRLFDWADEDGRSAHAIAQLLNAEGVPSPATRLKRKVAVSGIWSGETVRYLLSNPTYKGTRLMYRERIEGEGDQRRKVANDESQWLVIKGVCVEQLITPAQWQRVQDRQRTRSITDRAERGSREFLLINHLCCRCGMAMQCRQLGGNPRYHCRSMRQSTRCENCGSGTVLQARLDAAVWQVVVEALSEPEVVIAEANRRREEGKSHADAIALARAESDLTAIRAEIDRATRDQMRADEKSQRYATLEAIITANEQREREARREVERLARRVATETVTASDVADVVAACLIVGENAAGMDYAMRRRVLRALEISVRMTLDRKHYEVTGNIGGCRAIAVSPPPSSDKATPLPFSRPLVL